MLHKLPLPAARIYERIRIAGEKKAAAAREHSARVRQIRLELSQAQRELDALREAHERGQLLKQELKARPAKAHGQKFPVTYVRDDETLKAAEREVELIRERLAAAQVEPVETPSLSLSRIDAELAKHRGAFVEVERPTAEANPDALARIRAENLELIAERKRIADAPLPAHAVRAAVRDEIARLKKIPGTMDAFRGRKIEWPVTRIATGTGRDQYVTDTLGVFCWLFEDELVAKLEENIEFNAGAFKNAVEPRDRKAALDELNALIRDGERAEAAIVEAIVGAGGEAFHRPDIDVFAALGIAVA